MDEISFSSDIKESCTNITKGLYIKETNIKVLKYKLVSQWWTYKKLFWWIWFLAFFLSPMADNLTTALTLSTVLLTIDKKNKQFLVPSAINLVVAANAWWAWSPCRRRISRRRRTCERHPSPVPRGWWARWSWCSPIHRSTMQSTL